MHLIHRIRYIVAARWPLLILCMFFSFYCAIGAYPLFDNNEGLYASIAKYMLQQQDFIIPHVNHIVYIEKPPLLYWLMSLSFAVFGCTAFAARLVTVSSAALICLLLVYFGKKTKNNELGLISAIIFASSIGVSIIARMVYFDMLFTLMITGALMGFFCWYDAGSRSHAMLRIGYGFCALAVLTKGLIALVLIGGSFGLFLLWQRDYRKFYQALDPIGIMVFLLIVLPWHLAATLKHQGFAWSYLIEEHFLRFLGQREPHDYYSGPFYYYLPRIIIYMFPWSLWLPVVFWQYRRIAPAQQRLLSFCWCWLLVPLVFFSLSSAKANYYMIVSMPALALILGLSIKQLLHDSRIKLAFLVTAWLIIPLVLLMVWYIKQHEDQLSSAAMGNYLAGQTRQLPLYVYQDFEDISALFFYAPGSFKIVDSKSHDLYYGAKLPQASEFLVTPVAWRNELKHGPYYMVVAEKRLPDFTKQAFGANYVLLQKLGKLSVFLLPKA